jgi:PTH1 family peptidyl-tRNA hydrolase
MDPFRELTSLISDSSRKKIFVGLGNPGKQYAGTWHNLGKEFIAYLLSKLPTAELQSKTINGENTIVYQPQNLIFLDIQDYMNNSGPAIANVSKFLQIPAEQILVCYDDLDLDYGSYKLQVGRHPKVHNGVNSVISALGGNNFFHLRLGANQANREHLTGKDYVLGKANLPTDELFSQIHAEVFSSLGR